MDGYKVIGYSDSNPLLFNKKSGKLKCKDVVVDYTKIKEAYESPNDRIHIQDDLYMVKGSSYILLGCLKFKKSEFKRLLLNVIKEKNNG